MLSDISNSLSLYSSSQISFEEMAIDLARFQYNYTATYHNYCKYLGVALADITELKNIPFLPIDAFKHYKVVTEVDKPIQRIFGSSGTTGSTRSYHHLVNVNRYLLGAKEIFEDQYGDLRDYTVLGLLPNYLERNDSSLVAMVDYFIKESRGGGFYLNQYDELLDRIDNTEGKILLLGVSFGLLDFGEVYSLNRPNLIVMETGGMKGKRKEMTKVALHQQLASDFKVELIHSEYGMTELCSQCYSKGNGIFQEHAMMKLRIRDVTDPFQTVKAGKSGVAQVIDFNNIYSCAFIETQDLGRKPSDDTFEILERLDNSDLRGCNLLIS